MSTRSLVIAILSVARARTHTYTHIHVHGCDYASSPTSLRSSTRVDANKPVSVSQPPSLWVSVMREESNERRLGLVIKRPTGAEEILTHHPFRTADTDRPAEGGTRKERGG